MTAAQARVRAFRTAPTSRSPETVATTTTTAPSTSSTQQTTTEQASLANNGYAGTPKDNGTVFVNSDTADYPDTYLFINGYWFYASTNSLLELIVDNVFETPDQ